MNSRPYADAAQRYLELGWWPIPVDGNDGKAGVPAGVTGHDGRSVTQDDVRRWTADLPAANVALRVPADVVAIDVDAYDGKAGAETLAALQDELGQLPLTVVATARDLPSGKYLYRIPNGTRLRSTMGLGIDVVQRHHRYVVAAPSMHATAGPVRWLDSASGEDLDSFPEPGDLPDLPWSWLERFSIRGTAEAAEPADDTAVNAWLDRCTTDELRPWLHEVTAAVRERWSAGGSRHDAMLDALCWAAREAEAGAYPASVAIEELSQIWSTATAGEGRRKEFSDMMSWAVGQLDTANGRSEVASKRQRIAQAVADAAELPELGDMIAAPATTPPGDAHETEARSSWEPVDLRAQIDGEDVAEPALLRRTDGKALLYAGRVHWFQGESESCKTWAALHAAAQVIEDDDQVLVVDFEDDGRTFTARLQALGLDPASITSKATYVRPDEPLFDRNGNPTPGTVALDRVLTSQPYALAVIDGVTEAFSVEGLSPLDNADAAVWMRRLPKRIAAMGAAVVCIDHVTKSTENRGRYAIGAQHKLAAVTGASFQFTTLRPLARATHDPITGAVSVSVAKDRPGHVRAVTTDDGVVGTLELTSYPDGGLSVRLGMPSGSNGPDMRVVGKVLEFLRMYDGSSGRKIEDGVDAPTRAIRQAVAWATQPGRDLVRVELKGRSHLHFLTVAGEQMLAG